MPKSGNTGAFNRNWRRTWRGWIQKHVPPHSNVRANLMKLVLDYSGAGWEEKVTIRSRTSAQLDKERLGIDHLRVSAEGYLLLLGGVDRKTGKLLLKHPLSKQLFHELGEKEPEREKKAKEILAQRRVLRKKHPSLP